MILVRQQIELIPAALEDKQCGFMLQSREKTWKCLD